MTKKRGNRGGNLTSGPQNDRNSRHTQPKISNLNKDSSIITYRVPGKGERAVASVGFSYGYRLYSGGNLAGLPGSSNFSYLVGPAVVGNYSTCKFLPGTTINWEPTVGSTFAGRVHYCFAQSPEVVYSLRVMQQAVANNPTDPNIVNRFIDAMSTMGTANSFPVWMEKTISVPSNLRHKMFTVDGSIDAASDNKNSLIAAIDRSVQVGFFYYISVPPDMPELYPLGSFIYHDKVMVEGLSGVPTNL